MKWDEFNQLQMFNGNTDWRVTQTNLECPKCGKHIFLRNDIVLTTYPPQYSYFCECGWAGSSFTKWSKLTV